MSQSKLFPTEWSDASVLCALVAASIFSRRSDAPLGVDEKFDTCWKYLRKVLSALQNHEGPYLEFTSQETAVMIAVCARAAKLCPKRISFSEPRFDPFLICNPLGQMGRDAAKSFPQTLQSGRCEAVYAARFAYHAASRRMFELVGQCPWLARNSGLRADAEEITELQSAIRDALKDVDAMLEFAPSESVADFDVTSKAEVFRGLCADLSVRDQYLKLRWTSQIDVAGAAIAVLGILTATELFPS